MSNERSARLVTLASLALFGAIGLAFVVFGRVNGDEGRYLVAARLACQGAIPIVDFEYTRMYTLAAFLLSGTLAALQSTRPARGLRLAVACSVDWRSPARPARRWQPWLRPGRCGCRGRRDPSRARVHPR